MAQKYFDKDRLKRANPGEQLAFDWLADALPESYIVWHEPRVDGWKPDLVVFGAQIGLVILEVKDWSPNAIRGVDDRGRVLKAEGEETETHPLIQAEDAAQTIARRLEREPACRQSGSHRGKLAFPWACGGVLPNFRASQVTEFGLDRRHVEGAIITGEEIGGRLVWALSGDRLVKRLSRLKKIDFKWQITPPMKESLCRLLSPPTVIARSYAGRPRESDAAQRMLALEHTSLFTAEQEQVARNLGDGFQVLQGVVGSGKSEVVAARARILAEAHRGWRILVLCYNVSLGSWLRPRVFESGAIQGHDVTVAHFHDWCRELLDRSGISFGAELYSWRPNRTRPSPS